MKCDHWVDVGSGGGFPGLVVAICRHNSAFPSRVTLVESDQRKAVFLRESVRELGLSVDVISERIDKVQFLAADVLSARALAPLATLCEYASLHLKAGGTAVFPKGENYQSEVTEALVRWRFSVVATPSVTEPKAAILLLKDITHA